jgi:hypothetical protein
MDVKQLSSLTEERAFDIVVVGGGNAALCAAMAARERGASVLLLERAPEHMRAGNTRHTRNIRCVRVADGSGSSGVYSEDEFLEDLMQVTGSPPNMDLARRTIRESRWLPQWMSEHGISWQEPLAGTLNLGRTNRWFLGGGKALANSYYQKAMEMGVHVRYDAFVEDLVIESGKFQAAVINVASAQRKIGARAVVVGEKLLTTSSFAERHITTARCSPSFWRRALVPLATRKDFTRSQLMRERQSSMAGLSPVWMPFPLASWSIRKGGDFTMKEKIFGLSATRPGAA